MIIFTHMSLSSLAVFWPMCDLYSDKDDFDFDTDYLFSILYLNEFVLVIDRAEEQALWTDKMCTLKCMSSSIVYQ